MAAMAENRMNLAALQQRDPYITGIVDTGSQVALYSFSPESNEWEKTEVEGTLFVYTRSATPINGFMILNRLGLNDMIEPINKHLEFQLQDPFLLYRNGQSSICGVWFYDKDECARIGQLMNSLVQISIEVYEDSENGRCRRERRASEGELERGAKAKVVNNAGIELGLETGANLARNVDIMQMLSRAQNEYDQSKCPSEQQQEAATENFRAGKLSPSTSQNKEGAQQSGKRPTPKPMIDNPNASATKSTNIIKPLALKIQASATDGEDDLMQPVTPSTQISLDTLFKQVGASDSHIQTGAPAVHTAQPLASTQMPPLLQRIMSHPGSYLEEIERNQRGEILRDEMPKPAGAEAPAHLNNGAAVPKMPSPPKTVQAVWTEVEPDSPNTALRRSLNIFQDSPPRNDKDGAPGGPNPGFPGLRREGVGSSHVSKVGNVYTVSKPQVTVTTAPMTADCITGPRVSSGSNRGHTPPVQQLPQQQPPPHGNGSVQNLPKHMFPIQLPDTSVPPPQLPPLSSNSATNLGGGASASSSSASQLGGVSGINPLQHDALSASSNTLHSQLQQLGLTDTHGAANHTPALATTTRLLPPHTEDPGQTAGVSINVNTVVSRQEGSVGVWQPENPGEVGGGGGGGQQDWMAPPGSPSKKMGLITPMALIGAQAGVNKSLGSVSSQVSSSPLQTPGSVLLTPMAFETARVTPPGSGPQQQLPVLGHPESDVTSQKSVSPVMLDFHHQEPPPVNPLTREQLQQALVHMLKTDSSFLTSIHEAYVKSLQLSLKSDRP